MKSSQTVLSRRWSFAGIVWSIGLILVALIVSSHFAPTVESATSTNRPQAASRGFIGLPSANDITVQSLLSSTADLTVTFALTTGQVLISQTQLMPAESVRIYPGPPGVTVPVQGLVDVLANTQPDLRIFALNTEQSSTGNTAYLGVPLSPDVPSEPNCAGPMFTFDNCLPYAVKGVDGWTTTFVIQNQSPFSPANMVANFLDSQTGQTYYNVGLVPPSNNGSVVYDLSQIPEVPTGFVGSIIIISDQPFAIASAVHSSNGALGLSGDYRAGDAAMTGPVLVAPTLFNQSDLQTSELCVQNGYSITQTVSVAYSDGVTKSFSLGPVFSHCFEQDAEGHTVGWTGGAIITGTNDLLAIVNVTAYSDTLHTRPVGRWSYAVPSQVQIAVGAAALPLLYNHTPQANSTITIHVYNPGETTTVITPRYIAYPTSKVYCASSITMPAHSKIVLGPSDLPPGEFIGSGYLTATGPVAVVVSATSAEPLGTTDRHFGYEAGYPDSRVQPQAPCGAILSKVFLPAVHR
jgi:hypothetical protein